MSIRVGINGFGRIGRAFLKAARGHADIEIVAINDLADAENLAYLLRFDSVYGKAPFPIAAGDGSLVIDDVPIPLLCEKDPKHIPWKQHKVDLVVEATGVFASYEKARAHLTAGVRRVVVSAPVKDEPADAGVAGGTFLMGVNDELLGESEISSNASCTTNAASPLVAILQERIGIERALLNTVHGYTASQELVDGPHKKDPRRGRAAAINIVPSSTGAAIATTKAHTNLAGKFDGIALRVPVASGSIVDITFVAKHPTSVEEVNRALREEANTERWKGLFTVTDEPLVSSDILNDPHAAIADLSMTRVVDGTLVKVLAWYDNEIGYAHTLVRHVLRAGGAHSDL